MKKVFKFGDTVVVREPGRRAWTGKVYAEYKSSAFKRVICVEKADKSGAGYLVRYVTHAKRGSPLTGTRPKKNRGDMRLCCSTYADEPHAGLARCPSPGVFNDKERKVLALWLRDRRGEILPDRAPSKAELGVDLVKLLGMLIAEIENVMTRKT